MNATASTIRLVSRVSVVVPAFDVEPYLAACLQSLARQTERDLEVIVVDDGSTDMGRALAERVAARDRRFRVVTQPNRGLGAARNTGIAHATGEFLAFVDGDDVVPDDAYERMLRALDASGSDLATGNVQRLTRQGVSQARFLARTFARARARTHVSRFRPLLADRTAWNKLYRRSFWDAHGFRFPEGVVHEDIPVTLPAHLAARSVDVLAAPVYRWRLREDGALSITQRRLEHRVLRDRLRAVEFVAGHVRLHGTQPLYHAYLQSLVTDDLRLHLDLLDQADEAYRDVFVARANALLEDASPRIFAGLPAIDRLKWRLVRLGLVDELVDVLRFQHTGGTSRPVTRRRRRYHGDYPLRDDRRIPRSTFRLGRDDEDLALVASLDAVERDGDVVRLRGHAYVNGLGAPEPGAQRLGLVALPPGGMRAARLRMTATALPTAPLRRSDLGARRAWAGFEAVLDPAALGAGRWDLFVVARAGGLRRRRARFALATPALVGALDLALPGARLSVTADGALRVEVASRWARIDARRVTGGVLHLHGSFAGAAPVPRLRLRRQSDGMTLVHDAPLGAGTFRAAVPLADLAGVEPSLEAVVTGTPGVHEAWDLALGELALQLPEPLGDIAWASGGHDCTLARTRSGDATLETRRRHAPVALPAAVRT